MVKWKKLITNVIVYQDFQRLQATCKIYNKSLRRVYFDKNSSISGWWLLALHNPSYLKQCQLIIKLLIAPARFGKALCQKCVKYEANSLEHIMFTCESVQEERYAL